MELLRKLNVRDEKGVLTYLQESLNSSHLVWLSS